MLKFITGVLCGTAVGMLLAPAPGASTRRRLAQAVRDPEELARETIANVREKAGDIGARMGQQAAEKAVDQVVPDRLRSSPQRTG